MVGRILLYDARVTPKLSPHFWLYFHAPFPKAEGFSAYRMPGLLVHIPFLLSLLVLGAWLCLGQPWLYPFLLIYGVVGLYLGRDVAILAHYSVLITLVVLIAAFLLVTSAPAWHHPASLAGAAVSILVTALFGWYVNWRTDLETEGIPALHLAIQSKSIKAITRALDAGADANEKDSLIGRGNTPLHVAVELSGEQDAARALEIVELLVKRGADVNATSENGTALLLAVERKQDGLAKALLAMGADPNRAGKNGFVPLHAAARRGDRAMIETLLAAGADLNARNEERSVLTQAAWAGHLALIPWLLDKGANAAASADVLASLTSSTDPGVLDTMQRLIESGAPVTDGLLVPAATPEMIRFLAARGARADRLPPDKNPAARMADPARFAQRLRALREIGCNLAWADRYGETVLHNFVRGIESMPLLPEVLAELLPAGANVNAQDKEGRTPLYRMVESLLPHVTGRNIVGLKERIPSAKAIQWVAPLLDAGADPYLATHEGENTVALARRLKAPKDFISRLEPGARA